MKTDTYSGRLAGAIKKVLVQYNGRQVELMVTSREFAAAKQSGYYSQQMKLGVLGYYCIWKLVYWGSSAHKFGTSHFYSCGITASSVPREGPLAAYCVEKLENLQGRLFRQHRFLSNV